MSDKNDAKNRKAPQGASGGGSDAQPAPVENEQELKTLLHEVWQHTIAPHEIAKGVLKDKKDLRSDMTIVTASSLPKGSLEATIVGPMELAEAKGRRPKTVIYPKEELEAGKPRDGQTPPPSVESKTQFEPQGPTGTQVATDATPTARGGTRFARSTTTASRSTSAKALLQAAKKLASISVSRLVVQERAVVDAPAERESVETATADYEIERVLGEGGMGTVYIARQTAIDREIALKMIKAKLANNADIQAVFLAEAAVTGDLEHPNIIPIYDLGVTADGGLFYAMKQAKGVSWKNVLGQKTLQENVETLLKVADAVGFAHSRGIIHRDLKPENIMLGEFGEVLVMDWGLAACIKDGGKIGRLTKDNAAGGTPAYMAPEMATGKVELIGYRSDVHLLGAILYEIVTGVRPHGGKDMMDLLFNIATNKIQPSDKKGELVDIAMKAMEAKPEDRYPNVKAFQTAIRDTQKHFESIAMSDKAHARMEKAVQTRTYEDFAQALFGFEEALQMWPANRAAKQGALDTRLYYAKAAVAKEDLDLAESLIEPAKDQYGTFLTEIRAKMRSRAARRFRLRALTYASAALVAIFLIGVTIAYFSVSAAKKETELALLDVRKAKEAETKQRETAELAKQDAETQRDVAKAEKEKAEAQERLAIAAKKDADQQRVRAEEALSSLAKEQENLKQANTELDKRFKEVQEAQKKEREAYAAREEARLREEEARREREKAQAELEKTGMLLTAQAEWIFDAAKAKAQQEEAAAKLGKPVDLTIDLSETVKLPMKLLPPGIFVMGSPAKEASRTAEEYLHRVELTEPLYLGAREITRAEWEAVTGKPAPPLAASFDEPDAAVSNVTYGEVIGELLPKLNAKAPEGWIFRLPTEAEWEWACRGGRNEAFFVGDDLEELNKVAWFRFTSRGAPHPVAKLAPNHWGLFDMHGNVSEMCADNYDAGYYLASAKQAPLNQSDSKFRVVRGGSWVNLPQHCRSAYRSYAYPDNRYDHLGVRVALAPKAKQP
ncbi:MAG: SUMF1/EgtB/PvdO family nonheme iron enzyme [Planctomycetota bacterium]|nr:SUMF1/EgtB/PvdO family nonheme iron enzyme [Planctomycetota bacterium]